VPCCDSSKYSNLKLGNSFKSRQSFNLVINTEQKTLTRDELLPASLITNFWRCILKQVKYLCIAKSGVVLPNGVEAEHFYREDLSMFLAEQLKRQTLIEIDYVLVVGETDVVFGAELAIQYGLTLSVYGYEYDFRDHEITDSTKEQVLRELLSVSKEPKLFTQSLNELLNKLIKKVPLQLSEEQVEKLILAATPQALNIGGEKATDVAKRMVMDFFEQKKREVKDLVSPRLSDQVKEICLSYKNELVEYIKHNPGFYVLNERMGAGKSQDVIIPLFNEFSSTDLKPIVITPTIALSTQLINDKRNYQHQKELDVSDLKAVAACVISATANWKYQKYGKDSKVCLIEEFEECESAICSTELMYPKTLHRCSEAMEQWQNLLQTETVVVADAMFSNFSAQQIVKTGRSITLVKNTDQVNYQAKKLTVYSYQKQLSKLVDSLNAGDRAIVFCDGSHKFNGKFKTIAKVIEEQTDVTPIVVDSVFIQKDNPEYFYNLTSRVEEEQCHIFSPVVTSGVSVVTDKVNSVNIFACHTLLPTQLVQSSGRFRKSQDIDISFDNWSRFTTTGKKQIFNELAYKAYEEQCLSEPSSLFNDKNCQLVLDRIAHNRRMKQNYVFTTLQLFKEMGYDITLENNRDGSEAIGTLIKKLFKQNKNKLIEIAIDTVYDKSEHYFLKNSFGILTNEEQFKLHVYELQRFYNTNSFDNVNSAEQLIEFDKGAKSRKHLEHLLVLEGGFCSIKNPKLVVTQKIFKDIFQILNIDLVSLTASYKIDDIDKLAQYIKSEKIANYKVRDELIALGCSTIITSEYKSRGKLSQGILKVLFGLKQLEHRSGKGSRQTEYYSLCSRNSELIKKYFDLKFNSRIN